jgi:16S rRNA (uracil1498-N3)-methyltransferase
MNANKLDRLNKVAKEATKQCLRSIAPSVEYYDTLDKALSACVDYENKLFACEFAKESETDISRLVGSTVIVVGSEGGFSEAEAAEAARAGMIIANLGPRILRCETAPSYCLSAISYRFEL